MRGRNYLQNIVHVCTLHGSVLGKLFRDWRLLNYFPGNQPADVSGIGEASFETEMK